MLVSDTDQNEFSSYEHAYWRWIYCKKKKLKYSYKFKISIRTYNVFGQKLQMYKASPVCVASCSIRSCGLTNLLSQK